MRFSSLAVIVAITTAAVAGAQTSTKIDPVTECFRTNFPLALGMPMAAVPPEVRFYCAAPWNFQTFEAFRKAIVASRFDLAGSASRMSSGLRSKAILRTLTMAISAADKGPPSMGAVYLTYHVLPLAYALHKGGPDASIVEKVMDKQDVASLRLAAASINWKLAVIARTEQFPATSPVPPSATLADLSTGIFKHSQTKMEN
ncbi:MAG TPA: hypothetical protein H9903_18900 [Candidatus Aquabacterium excrementipullorum]|nr:hypothetical protein [Candidatus Aquabacterium excrementipullorum]